MLHFTKMQGLGNDYIYINCLEEDITKYNIPILCKYLSNRHFGVGSDGLILIEKSEKSDFKMTMYNKDSSIAKMCGNGIRCVRKICI